MNRIYKGALTALAVGLLMAVAAGAAQATPAFTAGAYPATAEGASLDMVIGTEGGPMECESTSFDGTLNGASSTLVLRPFYSRCVIWGGFISYTINNQECNYVLHATEKQGADQYGAHFGISCPAGGILWSAGTCTVEFPPQEGLTTVQVDDDTGAPNRITPAFEVTGLKYNVTKDGFACPFKGTGTKTDGTITSGAFSLKAVNPSKTTEERGLTVSGE